MLGLGNLSLSLSFFVLGLVTKPLTMIICVAVFGHQLHRSRRFSQALPHCPLLSRHHRRESYKDTIEHIAKRMGARMAIFICKEVTRASASVVAFGIGLFSGKGTLGPGKNHAFSVMSESCASDIWLWFHDNCESYKEYRKNQEPAVDKLKEPILDKVKSGLVTRYKLNFTRQDVASLWFLCKQKASLLQIIDQACGLFSASEVSLVEWTDDLEVFLLKGYGNSINYHMGIPLLRDILHSMDQAIVAKEENLTPGTFEKARLQFAHAETVIPFICLLGLFLEKSEFEQFQRDQPLDLPPKLPQKRN